MIKVRRAYGFTIVELLIVIVVIAILATISMVAYSGMQKRAYAAAAGMSRSNYVKLLKLYKIDHRAYPSTGGYSDSVCLGKPSDYPAKNGFAEGQCRYSDYSSANVGPSSEINSMLEEYGSLPEVDSWPSATETYAGYGTDYYRGIFYSSSVDGSSAYIWYFLPGKNTCAADGYGTYDSETGDTQCTILLQ